MIRSRIGSRAEVSGERTIERWLDAAAPSLQRDLERDGLHFSERVLSDRASSERRPRGVIGFVLDIALPAALRGARSLGLSCLVALGCDRGRPVELEGVVRDGRTGAPIAGAQITTEDGRVVATDEDGRFLARVASGSEISLRAEGRCSRTMRIDDAEISAHLFERLEVERERTQVGFDTEVRIEVRARCDREAPLEWRQIGGPELGDRMRARDRGRTLVVRTHPIEELVRLDDRMGIVAIDRAARGEYRFEVSGELEGEREVRTVRVLAAPSSSGLFQTPTGADVYLNGGPGADHAWRIAERPEGSRASISADAARIAIFRPDRFGAYTIEHTSSGVQMLLTAGAYDDVPRDCGREGCHSNESAGWESTAHARTFRRGLEGELGADFEERCWSCHATGVEHGVENGGLHHTAARLGWHQSEPDAGAWERAPRLIRRHGSVWCSACHGPGRILPPQFHWQYGSKFQVGVCARCHDVDEGDPDANHVSPQVDEWRIAAMSSFLRDLEPEDPALRSGCAQCHSAQGFVSFLRGHEVVPERATVAPIACAACHDAHDASRPHALRVYDDVSIAGEDHGALGSGALCASCHRSTANDVDAAPHAPQGDLLVGRGARLARDEDGGVHRFIADTCVRCHMTRPQASDPLYRRAGGHTFSIRARTGGDEINAASCAPCHGDAPIDSIGARDRDGDGTAGSVSREHEAALARLSERLRAQIAARAIEDRCGRVAADAIDFDARLVLVDAEGRMLGDCDGDGRFAEGETPITAGALPRSLADAAYDLAMLRADGSMGYHNPSYAFSMIEALSRALH
jgi:hypothetical protein